MSGIKNIELLNRGRAVLLAFAIIGVVAVLQLDLPVQENLAETPVQAAFAENPLAVNELNFLDTDITGLTLEWKMIQDNAEIAAFKVYRDNEMVATVSGSVHTYKVSGLKPDTWYQFTVAACDASGNCGSGGPLVGVRTLSAQQVVESMMNKVNNLVSSGALNPDQGNALIEKLAFIYQLDQNNAGEVSGQLQSFINNINSLINSGVLSPEVGQPLILNANDIINNAI